MLRHRARGPSLELLAIVSLVFVSTAAAAGQVYSLSGKFVSNLGRNANFPMIGDVACPEITLDSGPVGTAGFTPPREANRYGCIPVKGKATTTGKGVGGAFAMPPNVLKQPAQSSNGLPKHWLPAKNVAPLRQISTSIAFAGPAVARTGLPGSMADGMNTAAFRAFRAGAWATQTGRLGSDFTWCPGGCTSSANPVVTYHARNNRFGGTMGLLMWPGPNGSREVLQAGAGGVGTGTMGSMLGNVIFAPLDAIHGSRPTGAGYAVRHTDLPTTGSLFAKYMTAMTTWMRITMGTSYVGPVPLPSLKHYGFPFTTGTVVVRYKFNGGSTTLVAAGGDEVTPMGARNISLVAGGISVDTGSPIGARTANMAQVLLPEPGAAGLVAGVVTLLGIAWRRSRS